MIMTNCFIGVTKRVYRALCFASEPYHRKVSQVVMNVLFYTRFTFRNHSIYLGTFNFYFGQKVR